MASRIRVRFSGVLLFMGNLTTLLTGLIFNVLIARNLHPTALGVWFFIGSVTPYFQILEKAVPYWAGREIPRGHEVGKTTLLFNIAISIPITLTFIFLSNTLSSTIGAEPRVFILASLFLPVYYATAALTAVTYSTTPHKLGLRTIIIDGIKIPLSLLLLPFGLEGVITAVIAGNIAYATYLYKTSQQHLTDKYNIHWLRDSLKKIWLPLHENVVGYLSTATDALIIGIALTSVDLSNYGIALAVASVVGTTKGITAAIYPKLLAEGKTTERELKAIFKFLYIFITPMIFGGTILTKQLVEIFGTRYLPAAPVLPLLLISPAVGIISLSMKSVVTGLEKTDRETNSSKLLKSTLFTTQLPNYIYLAVLVVGTTALVGFLGIMGAAIARLTASILSSLPMAWIYSKKTPITTVVSGLEKTVPASLVMAAVLLLLNPVGSIQTLISILIGGTVYFATLLTIDKDSRQLAQKAVQEAKKFILTQAD